MNELISSKYSVAGTLYHRAKTVSSNPQLLQKEEDHPCRALKKCKYPTWAINRAKLNSQNPTRSTNRNNNNQTGQNKPNNKNLHMVVPYQQGLSERIKNTCKNMGYRYTLKEVKPSKAF